MTGHRFGTSVHMCVLTDCLPIGRLTRIEKKKTFRSMLKRCECHSNSMHRTRCCQSGFLYSVQLDDVEWTEPGTALPVVHACVHTVHFTLLTFRFSASSANRGHNRSRRSIHCLVLCSSWRQRYRTSSSVVFIYTICTYVWDIQRCLDVLDALCEMYRKKEP